MSELTPAICPDNEPGEVAFGYHAHLDTYVIVLRDLNRRPIACVTVDRVALLAALTLRTPATATMVPHCGAFFHLHTLKGLICDGHDSGRS